MFSAAQQSCSSVQSLLHTVLMAFQQDKLDGYCFAAVTVESPKGELMIAMQQQYSLV